MPCVRRNTHTCSGSRPRVEALLTRERAAERSEMRSTGSNTKHGGSAAAKTAGHNGQTPMTAEQAYGWLPLVFHAGSNLTSPKGARTRATWKRVWERACPGATKGGTPRPPKEIVGPPQS